MNTTTIIVGVEGEHEGHDAIALGADLATAFEASLLLAGVYAPVYGINAYDYELVAKEAVDARLARARRTAGVACQTRAVGSTSVVRGLHQLAEHTAAEMLVIGPTHHGRVARALAGDVTLGLLQAAPCAVAIAPAGYADREARHGVVGVGYVPTDEGREALDAAIQLAARTGARLRILHSGPGGEEALDDARLEAPTDMEVETVVLDGVGPEDLLRTASAGLDVLVIGSRGYGPMHRVLLGSVSAAVVHDAACPVLVLPRGATVPARAEVRA